jgi:hypothetical protein
MNNRTLERLSKYSSAAASVLALSAVADAQIVYTDVNPDVAITDTTRYYLDLNNDGTTDFWIYKVNYSSSSSTYGGIVAVAASSNSSNLVAYTQSAVQLYGSSSGTYLSAAVALDGGDWVNGAVNFNYGGILEYHGDFGQAPFSFGQFAGVGDKFLGFKFMIGQSFYYGWARVEVPADGSMFTVRDYAYFAGSGFPIQAGDTGSGIIQTGVEEAQANGITLFHSEGMLTIAHEEPQQTGQLNVYNMNGALVQEAALTAGQNTLQLDQMSAGIYLVRAHYGTAILTKKIVVQD